MAFATSSATLPASLFIILVSWSTELCQGSPLHSFPRSQKVMGSTFLDTQLEASIVDTPTEANTKKYWKIEVKDPNDVSEDVKKHLEDSKEQAEKLGKRVKETLDNSTRHGRKVLDVISGKDYSVSGSGCSTPKMPLLIPNTPTGPICPKECPYTQTIAGDSCSKVCIQPDYCKNFHPGKHFPDPETKTCLPTCGASTEHRIAACAECAGEGRCSKCMTTLIGEFTLSEDGKQCTNPWHLFWKCVYVFLGLAVLFTLWYLVTLWARGAKNQDILDLAMLHRTRCCALYKASEEDMDGSSCSEWKFYSFWANVHRKDIAGKGAILFFNWMTLMMILAVVLGALVFAGYSIADDRKLRTEQLRKLRCETPTYNHEDLLAASNNFEHTVFVVMTIVSVFATGYCLCCYGLQMFISRSWNQGHLTQSMFIAELGGLPCDFTDDEFLSSEITRITGFEVEGCIFCYDSTQEEDSIVIDGAIHAWVQDAVVKRAREGDVHLVPGVSKEKYQELRKTSEKVARLKSMNKAVMSLARERSASWSWWQCSWIDGKLVYLVDEPPEQSAEEVCTMLSRLETSGYCYVVFSHGEDAKRFRNAVCEDPGYLNSVKGLENLKLTAYRVLNEPLGVCWENYVKDPQLVAKFTTSVLILLGVIGLWAMCYLPYAIELISQVGVPGRSTNIIEGTILALLIAIGNAIAGVVIESTMDWVGFVHKDVRDIAVMCLAFFSNMLNLVADLYLTIALAEGSQANMAFSSDNELNYEQALANELFWVIVPSYVLTPYIAQPFLEYILPFFLGKWIVRSRSVREVSAGKAMEPPGFDICWRYADTLNNFTVCSLMLFLYSEYVFWAMVCLFLFLILIYWQDRYKLLRAYAKVDYTTRRLSNAFAVMLVFPTTVLAVVACSWWIKLLVFVAVAHAAVYILCAQAIYRLAKSPDFAGRTYQQTVAAMRQQGHYATYFNTNRVHCLRTRYLESKKTQNIPSEMPFVRGKDYLHCHHPGECTPTPRSLASSPSPRKSVN